VAPLPWAYVGLVWAYCLAWIFVEDQAKLLTYRVLDRRGREQQRVAGRQAGAVHAR
jgi:H+-transporting ATPase